MEQIVVLAALLGLCCLLLHVEGLMPPSGGGRAGVFVLLLAAFGARYYLLDRVPSAAEDAVREAITYFRGAGGFWGLRACTAPFSLPVQYFLALFSHAPRGGLYLFKYLSFFAEVVMAWACQRCAGSVTVKPRPRRGVFLAVLLLPSVLLQGCAAMGQGLRWVFVALAAAAVLKGNFRMGGAMLGLAAAFHPGALWVLPLFWVFPAVRQNSGRTLLWLIGTYAATLLPALLLGRPPAITLPFWPGAAAAPVNAGAPGLYSLEGLQLSAPVGIAAYAVLAALTVYRLSGRDALHDRRRQLAGLCLAALAVGGLLPRAGAAALCGGEVFTIALCALEPGMLPAAVCASAASALAVGRALFPALLPYPLWWASAALLAAMVLLLGAVLFKRA